MRHAPKSGGDQVHPGRPLSAEVRRRLSGKRKLLPISNSPIKICQVLILGAPSVSGMSPIGNAILSTGWTKQLQILVKQQVVSERGRPASVLERLGALSVVSRQRLRCPRAGFSPPRRDWSTSPAVTNHGDGVLLRYHAKQTVAIRIKAGSCQLRCAPELMPPTSNDDH